MTLFVAVRLRIPRPFRHLKVQNTVQKEQEGQFMNRHVVNIVIAQLIKTSSLILCNFIINPTETFKLNFKLYLHSLTIAKCKPQNH